MTQNFAGLRLSSLRQWSKQELLNGGAGVQISVRAFFFFMVNAMTRSQSRSDQVHGLYSVGDVLEAVWNGKWLCCKVVQTSQTRFC